MLQPGLKKVDLHVHTVFSNFRHLKILKARDSYNDPLQVYERCRAIGCDYVAITDHDTIDGALDLLSKRPDLEPGVIIGEEVESSFPETGQWVHVNVLNVDEKVHDEMARLKGNVHDLVGYLRGRGLPHFLNHPLQSYRLQRAPMRFVEDLLSLFSHVEVGNGTLPAGQNRAAVGILEYGRRRGVACVGVGGSDSHGIRRIGSYVTLAEGETKEAWLASVQEGRCLAYGSEIGFLGMVSEVYAIVGRYYRRLGSAGGRAEMGAINYAAAAGFVPICLAGVPLLLNVASFAGTAGLSGLVRRSLRRQERLGTAAAPVALSEAPTAEPPG